MTIPLILASKSVPRRNVLYSAGVCPTIRVSHVDEPAALEHAAEQAGVGVDELSVRQRVMILAEAKAQAVYQAYRNVAEAAAAATGERVTAYPLKAAGVGDAGSVPSSSDPTAVSTSASSSASPASGVTGGKASDITRDFSGVDVPTTVEPIHTPADGAGKGGSGVNGTDADDTGSTGANGSGTNNASAIQGLTTAAVGPLILGCDSMFLFNGECHGKPHSADVARKRLRAMRGHSGELWTGHCLIDFATGRVARGASHAIVHFSDYSDRDIERYIATGEPLEVAGSFTLEGFGGAFIDGIEGDPHGIIGLSLPLARRLAGELGVEWTDLWNVARGDHDPAPKSDGVTSSAAGSVPPKENVHQPGDGWIDCDCGRRHWGLNGASGVLLARRDAVTGKVTHVVMQHRALWSAEGGTWGIPGGATADGESAIEGALRESYEEANITPEDIEVVGAYREDHGNWAYTTVFAFEKPGHTVTPRANDDESMEIEWVPIDEVPNRRLLTAMRTDWPRFRARLDAIAEEPAR